MDKYINKSVPYKLYGRRIRSLAARQTDEAKRLGTKDPLTHHYLIESADLSPRKAKGLVSGREKRSIRRPHRSALIAIPHGGWVRHMKRVPNQSPHFLTVDLPFFLLFAAAHRRHGKHLDRLSQPSTTPLAPSFHDGSSVSSRLQKLINHSLLSLVHPVIDSDDSSCAFAFLCPTATATSHSPGGLPLSKVWTSLLQATVAAGRRGECDRTADGRRFGPLSDLFAAPEGSELSGLTGVVGVVVAMDAAEECGDGFHGGAVIGAGAGAEEGDAQGLQHLLEQRVGAPLKPGVHNFRRVALPP
ncbi:hypothetical protein B296_00039188 [Ensete ventricosum]|uniref:Uncharacterized protein n=1 Tax=Ensete ventricosum TaxID=4639 RepID=A0A426X1I3_ENSVE|nr:hypothetical protein B296_00039188 [Ensete ventricosum]